MYVYLIRNVVNNKYYIGKTKRDLALRWKEHQQNYDSQTYFYFQQAVRKYGPQSFEVEVVAESNLKSELDLLEKLWIITLRSYDPKVGYNQRFGGNDGHITEEVKLKMAKSHTGKKHSLETRLKIGKGNTGCHRSLEVKEKLRNLYLGKRWANNGIYSRQVPSDYQLPAGWSWGTLPFTQEHCINISLGRKKKQ